MNANEILTYLRNEGGFQYFCNNDGWPVKKCVEWVRKNFKCTRNAAQVVGEEIQSWT